MTTGRAIATRLALAVGVVILIVGVTAVAALLATTSGSVDEGPAHPEYDAEQLAPDRLESAGQANPQGDVGVVLFDRSHTNRFQEEEIAPFVHAIDRAGGDVRFTGVSTGFEAGLEEADVLVIVDPGTQYGQAEVDAIEQFVDDGGRLVLVGEPNRKSAEAQGLEVQLSTDRAKLTTVASPFGVSFGSQYLYDMEHNDGNFKNVVVSPPAGTDAGVVDGVDQVAMYTATAVEANRGTVLLRTADSAERGNDATNDGYPVAVLAGGGDVLAVGDKTFLSDDYHSVADNDVFLQRIVEYMAGADRRSSPRGGGTDGSPNSSAVRSAG